MWMLRLLPGMGPEAKAPIQRDLTGKTVIRLKPSAALPPANVNARTIGACCSRLGGSCALPEHGSGRSLI